MIAALASTGKIGRRQKAASCECWLNGIFPMKTPCRVDDAILKQMVDAYIRDPKEGRDRKRKQLEWFKGLRPRLDVAILDAVKIDPTTGKKHAHQKRNPKDKLADAHEELQAKKEDIRAAKDFDALHDIVQREIGHVKLVGNLAIYDIALRIGAFLGKEPKRVYLQRGSAEGARLLGFAGKTIDPQVLPDAFSRLTPAEIEDFLCVRKSRLAAAVKRGVPSPTGC